MCIAPGEIIRKGNAKPSDIIPRDAVTWDGLGNIRIDLTPGRLNIPFTKSPEVWIPPTPATKSMLPTFGAGHNNLFLKPADSDEHKILCDWLALETKKGFQNIIVFKTPLIYAVHRVVKYGEDNMGRYFRTKGDNVFALLDPDRIRDGDIQYISAGIIF